MSNAAHHVIKVSEILRERSLEALKAFDAGDEDLALECLKFRDIGFANLRTAEWHAVNEGFDLSKDEEVSRLFRAILELDARLIAAIAAAKERAELELRRVKRVRQRVSKYHSGSQEGSRFEKPV